MIKKSAAPNGNMNIFQVSEFSIWKSTISRILNDPLTTAIERTVISSGISYAVNCAADRIPPMRVYLLLDAQPAKKTPRGAIPKIAIKKRRDKSGFAAQI